MAERPRARDTANHVVKRERLEDGAQLVKAVRPRAKHAQVQIDLRVRANRYGIHDPSGPTSRSSSSVIGSAPGSTFTVNAASSSALFVSICESVAVRSTHRHSAR